MSLPHLSPDGLFCGEEAAEVLEDLESAEFLLAGQGPRQKMVMGSRQWVQAPSPVRGWGLTSSIFPQAPTSLSCHPEATLRAQQSHRWAPFTAGNQSKGEMPSVSLSPACPAGAGCCLPIHTPQPQPHHPQVPPMPLHGSGCSLAGTSLGGGQQAGPGACWHESWACWACWACWVS